MLRILIPLFILSILSQAQTSDLMERLLYEFPHGRPAYAPLENEFEIAPRVDVWRNNQSPGTFYSLDMEYAVSKNIVLETGISYINTDINTPAFVQESGLDFGGYYTVINQSRFILTIGMESHFRLENESNDQNKYSFEPVILAAGAINKLQIHVGINSEIAKTVKPGFFIAGIYKAGLLRPYIEILKPNELNNTIVLTPGFVFPVYHDVHGGFGIPFSRLHNISRAGLTFFVAIELGDDD